MNALYLVAPLIGAVLGYRSATQFAATNGRVPWGWPPAAWAVVVGVSLLFGGLLIIVARRTSKPQRWTPPAGAPVGYPGAL